MESEVASMDCRTAEFSFNQEKKSCPEKLHQDLGKRLNRIEGQVKGIKGMIDKETYCDDVLHQISAVQSALSSVSKILLENHIKTCVTQKLLSGDTEVVEELIKTIGKIK